MASPPTKEPGAEVGVFLVQGEARLWMAPLPQGCQQHRRIRSEEEWAQFQLTPLRMVGDQEESLSEHTAENGPRGWRLLPLRNGPSIAGIVPCFFCIIILTASQPIVKWILWLEN